MKTRDKLFLWVFLAVITGLLSTNMYYNLNTTEKTAEPVTVTEVLYKPYLQREEINHAIKEKITRELVTAPFYIYDDIAGDPGLARRITEFALEYNIPVCLLFSVIYVESSFDPEAVNKNRNGTYDYGLMSLNSRTFQTYTRDELFNVDTNIRLGCEYLVMLRKRYGSWGEAVIHYNGLYTKGAGTYMVRVMEKEREFEKLFNDRI
jgi:soluble lytic murein transglycosylase-like protein